MRRSRPSLFGAYRGWGPFVCVLGAIALLAGSAIVWVTSPGWGVRPVIAAPRSVGRIPTATLTATAPAGPTEGPVAPTRPASTATPAPLEITPDGIAIPALGVDAPVVGMRMTHRVLRPPLPPTTAGWWTGGPKPGARAGTVVIAGHINYGGVTGALSRIGRLDPGDRVIVHGEHGGASASLTFRVTAVRTYLKRTLPWAQVFDQHVPARLVLITCGGPLDAASGNYLDNIVVYAVPA